MLSSTVVSFIVVQILGTTAITPVLLLTGGAGDIPEYYRQITLDCIQEAVMAGYKVLQETNDVIEACEIAINFMEAEEAFNAGIGSVLNWDGHVEMEAMIIEGKDLSVGAVASVENVTNPISVARKVMEEAPHIFLAGDGAEEFIQEMEFTRITEDCLITENAKKTLAKFKSGKRINNGVGGVGCVAINEDKHVAAGTSSGGVAGKYKGSIGYAPIVGGAAYSDDDIGAVVTSGYGETITKYNLAFRILSSMEKGESPQNASEYWLNKMKEKFSCEGHAGAIAITKNCGDVGIAFTTKRMTWAYIIGEEMHYGQEPDEDEVETVTFSCHH